MDWRLRSGRRSLPPAEAQTRAELVEWLFRIGGRLRGFEASGNTPLIYLDSEKFCPLGVYSPIFSGSLEPMSGQVRTPEDRAQLLLTMRRQTPSRVLRRMNTLRLLGDGWVAERVAEILFIDVETVREHRRP